MESSEKRVYDILVKAEWLDNVKATESEFQKGVFERVLHSRTGATLLDNGKFRLWLFSKLYRELLKAGPVAASRAAKLGGTVATVGFPNIGLQGFATSERDG